jgi:hypothetical protein
MSNKSNRPTGGDQQSSSRHQGFSLNVMKKSTFQRHKEEVEMKKKVTMT